MIEEKTYPFDPCIGIIDFYGLEEIVLKTNNSFIPSLSRLNDEARNVHQYLTHKQASVMSDYFTLACGAEMAYAKLHCQYYYKDFYYYDSRTHRKAFVSRFEKESLINGAIALFDKDWNKQSNSYHYGGKNWKRIAELVLSHLQKRITDREFFDCCMGICHNNGMAIDKGYPLPFDVRNLYFIHLLEMKRHYSVFDDKWERSIPASKNTICLFRKARNLGVINSGVEFHLVTFHDYPKIDFGDQIFNLQLVYNDSKGE